MAKIKSFTKTYACDKPHYPYELPKGWVWCRLEELCCIKGGKRIPRGFTFSKSKTKHVYLRVTDMKECSIMLTDLKYIDDDVFEQIKNYTIDSNDLYLTIAGTIGSVGIIPKEVSGMNLTENAAKLTNISCVKEYLLYALLSSTAQEHFTSKFHQVAQPKLSIETASTTPIALPPINEQIRIVSEIERTLKLIDGINNNKNELQTAIKQAKRKILDLAIHGKLVPQDPNDEPATELLKRINPKAEITCDNPQYGKLPKGWCLILGKDLYKPMKSAKPKGLVFKYIDIDSIDSSKQCVDCVKVVRIENAPSRASRYTQKGDIVFSMVRPYLKNIAIVSEDECIASTGFYICSPSDVAISEYCYYLMISDYTVNGLNQFMKGDNSPSINKSNIDNCLFPIPPLSEQHRIAAKIEELFAQLDKIESSLQA